MLLPTIAVAGCSEGLETATNSSTDVDVDISPAVVERRIFELANGERTDRGMDSLSWNDDANEVARTHAENMAAKDFYNHTAPDGTTQLERWSFCGGGENIDKSYVGRRLDVGDGETLRIETDEGLAQHFHAAWMNSPPHRDRGILGPWATAGPGIAVDEGGSGAAYAVLGFCPE